MRGLKILDENESIITSFNYIANEKDYSDFKPKLPTLIVDKFAEKRVIIDEEQTETLRSYNDLNRMGYVVISQKINPKKAWFTGQRVFFRLCPAQSIPKNCTVYSCIPRMLFVRYDYVNKLIRLEDKDRRKGRHKNYSTSESGCGDWYQVN